MIGEVCAEIRNWFTFKEDKHIGDFSIVDGTIVPAVDSPAGYIRIIGSRLNDGVHRLEDNDLEDEGKFHGAVWAMSPPKDFIRLVDEIKAWVALYGAPDSQANSPFTSESFTKYSYSKGGSSSRGSYSGSGAASGWRSIYGAKLNRWRKL